MSMTQTTTDQSSSDTPRCPKCATVLPPHATFCSKCGTRIGKENGLSLLLQDNQDTATRYRITSLVRRRPFVNLFFALDTQQQRMVAIRDIDISSLSDEVCTSAIELAQREYDLLRRQHIPDLMPVIDLRYFQKHLVVVSGWPIVSDGTKAANTKLHTLYDFLQSGIGLPDEQDALSWIERLCHGLDQLHSHQVVIGDLDPHVIVLNETISDTYPALMVSWLPLYVRSLLPQASTIGTTTSFSAPEALLGKAEPRSDIYSLGAILYLLLTGAPPDEPSLRLRHSLRSPRELNPRISTGSDALVMRALSVERSERFQSAEAMSEAVSNLLSTTKTVRGTQRATTNLASRKDSLIAPPPAIKQDNDVQQFDELADVETVEITPLPRKVAEQWQASRTQSAHALPPAVESTESSAPSATSTPPITPETPQQPPEAGHLQEPSLQLQPGESSPDIVDTGTPPQESHHFPISVEDPPVPLAQRLRKQITGMLPAIPRQQQPSAPGTTTSGALAQVPEGSTSLLKRIQRMVLGEQQHNTMAMALIEHPLRVQPKQNYTIRIQLTGRNAPILPPGVKKGERPRGLSALAEGDLVHIEVRSALYQSFAYIVQQAVVHIPAQGYAAEVDIPMQPFTTGPSGRRERMHIFFMDEHRRPLYEKPFVIELFVSHLVQPGREGHNVLSIPV